MDARSQLEQLERACVAFQQQHSPASEEMIDSLGRRDDLIQFCQYALSHTQIPFVQFVAIKFLRENIIRKWPSVSVDVWMSVVDFLLHFLLHHSTTELFVQAAILQCVAVLCKRGLLEKNAGEIDLLQRVLDQAELLVAEVNPRHRGLGIRLLSEVVTQHSLTWAAQMGLPHSFHINTSLRFENVYLPRIFRSVFSLLKQPLEGVLSLVVEIASQLFGWEFLGAEGGSLGHSATYRVAGASLSGHTVAERLRPNSSWRSLLLGSDTLALLFRLHSSLRQMGQYPKEAHALRECMLSLASVTGRIFSAEPSLSAPHNTVISTGDVVITRGDFLARFVSHLLPLLADRQVPAQLVSEIKVHGAQAPGLLELQDTALIVGRLLSNHGAATFLELPLLPHLLEALSQRICIICSLVVAGTVRRDANWVANAVSGQVPLPETSEAPAPQVEVLDNEALGDLNDMVDTLLSGLSMMVMTPELEMQATSDLSKKHAMLVSQAAEHVFAHCVRCALVDQALDVFERTEGEDDPSLGFEDEERLFSLAYLARAAIDPAFNLLHSFLNEILGRLVSMLHRSSPIPTHSDAVLNQARWLVLCTGHCIAESVTGSGETPLIPSSIVHFATMRKNHDQTEPVSALTACIGSLLEAYAQVMEGPGASAAISLISPLLLNTLLSYFQRWVPVYLHPNETLYECTWDPASHPVGGEVVPNTNHHCISPSFSAAYGNGSAGAASVIELLARACVSVLLFLNGEAEVTTTACRLLLLLVTRHQVGIKLISTPQWHMLVQSHHVHIATLTNAAATDGSHHPLAHVLGILVPQARRLLYESLFRSSTCSGPGQTAVAAFQALSLPIHEALKVVATEKGQGHHLIQRIVALVEVYRGAARATEPKTHAMLYEMVAHALDYCPCLLSNHPGDAVVVVEILKLFKDVAEQQASYMSKRNANHFFSACLTLLNVYSTEVAPKMTRGAHQLDNEKLQYRDLVTLVRMLKCILIRDVVEFVEKDSNDHEVEGASVGTVVSAGISIVLPLLTADILSYPKLSRDFFALLGHVMEVYPDVVMRLPTDVMASFVRAVEYGLQQSNEPTSVRACLDAVYALGALARKMAEQGAAYAPSKPFCDTLAHFLLLFLTLLLNGQLDRSLYDCTSDALLSLILVLKESYLALAEEAVRQVAAGQLSAQGVVVDIADPQAMSLLSGAFTALTEGLSGQLNRENREQMRKNVTNFVSYTKSFLKKH